VFAQGVGAGGGFLGRCGYESYVAARWSGKLVQRCEGVCWKAERSREGGEECCENDAVGSYIRGNEWAVGGDYFWCWKRICYGKEVVFRYLMTVNI
jgi:hypothetical protein